MKIFQRIIYFRLIIICVIAVAGFSFFMAKSSSKPMDGTVIAPVKGVLDLSSWNPEDNGLLELSGEWNFYWNRLLSFDEVKNADPHLVISVPSVWNSYTLGNKKLPGFGYGTYVLNVKNLGVDNPIALRFANAGTAYRLYINERLIAANGTVSTSKQNSKPDYGLKKLQFQPPGRNFKIVLQISNYDYSKGGMWYPLYIGTPQAVQHLNEAIIYRDLFLLGAFLIMALYYLTIYLMRRDYKGSLYFVLLCIIAIVRTLITGEYMIYKIFPSAGFKATVMLDFLSLYWFPAVYMLLYQNLISRKTSTKFIKILIVFGCVMTAISFITPIFIFASTFYLNAAIIATTVIYVIISAIRRFGDQPADAAVILLGSFAMVFGVIHDTLYNNNLIESRFGEISASCFLILISLSAFLLAKKYSKDFKYSEFLSEKLSRLDKLKDEFLANTSHELRTPLNAIINIADGLLSGAEGTINKNQGECLKLIASSGRSLSSLVNDILDFSKMKHGDIKLNFTEIDLKDLAERVLTVFKYLKLSGTVDIFNKIPDDLPNVYGDRDRVNQIFSNLIGNAVKFTAEGYIKISADFNAEFVNVSVEDTGIGIPEDRQEDIFKSFEQVETSETIVHEGIGLGLSITRRLVELHGGRIYVNSKPGKGSIFTFSLPVCKSMQKKEKNIEDLNRLKASEHNDNVVQNKQNKDRASILVVDDNHANLRAVSMILDKQGYNILTAYSTAAALEVIRKDGNINLVITDVMMPKISGLELCKEIRKLKSLFELPVLMLTARTLTNDITAGFEAGANDYLSKPFEADELIARVRTLMEMKESVDKALRAELKFLQSQIRPHFIHNALNTVVSISRRDADQARRLLVEFSNYLRYCFDFENLEELVPLEREMEFVRSYVSIECARFGERLKMDYDIDELLLKIPPLILQPLVENAVIHGLRTKLDGGNILVYVKKSNNKITLGVKDTGVGMSDALLSELKSGKRTTRGVGFYNINQRLRKLYGISLQIESVEGKGTDVFMEIPFAGGM